MSSIVFSLLGPAKGNAGDVLFLLYEVSKPSPPPQHNVGPHAVQVAADKKLLVRNGYRPDISALLLTFTSSSKHFQRLLIII